MFCTEDSLIFFIFKTFFKNSSILNSKSCKQSILLCFKDRKKQSFDQNHKDEVFSQRILKAKHRFAKKKVLKAKQRILNSSILETSKSNVKMRLCKEKKLNKKGCKEVVLHFFFERE